MGNEVKKRGWVKNAAIIFLAVLLVLTLFSNTFMNRSLPEVATAYVQQGPISAQIRGSGTVTAAEVFEVKSTTSRKVLSVPVQVGDDVKVGDTLILFSDAEAEEIKTAQDALDEATLAYQKALINASSGKYSAEKKAITDAQVALDEAKAERDKNTVTDAQITNADNAINSAKAQVLSCEVELAKAEAALAAIGTPSTGTTGDYNAVIKARNTLDAKKLQYSGDLANFYATVNANRGTTSEAVFAEYLASVYAEYDEDEPEYKQFKAYSEVKKAQETYDAALAAYNEAYTPNNQTAYNAAAAAVKTAEGNLEIANNALTAAKDAKTELLTKKETYDTSVKAVSDAQRTLQDAILALEKAGALESLDFAEMKKNIEEQRKALEGMKAGGEGAVVKSQINGRVSAVNVSAGNLASPETALMTVEVPDLGYTVSFSVTKEQAQRLRIGAEATVKTGYWGDSGITGNLSAVKSDPTNPTTNKMLVFKLSGEVESGANVSLTVGEKSSNYDAIVPNSAIREDANGKFVLAVLVKSSPIGNRFIATRIDVEVRATDDTNSAVTGALVANTDMVITTSSKPIEPGMQVRLPD